jgi:hypothetical protein
MLKKRSGTQKHFTKFVDAKFLFSTVVVPLLVLSIYFLGFAFFLPNGVNKVFAKESWKYSIALTSAIGFVALALYGYQRNRRATIAVRGKRLSNLDLTLLLFPLMPISQYVIRNQEILSPFQILDLLGIFLLFSVLFVIVIPKLLGWIASTRTLMLLGTCFTYTILNMAAVSAQHHWFQQGNLTLQWQILTGLFVVSWFLDYLNYQNFLYLLIVFLFIGNSVYQISQVKNELPSETQSALTQLVGERKPFSRPNIYLLVYDAYVPNETMMAYGIDNSQQEQNLAELGFTLYPQTYSVSNTSIDTMGRVLNASVGYGSVRQAAAGNAVATRLLKTFGYETYGIFSSDYFFRNASPAYDHSFPDPQPISLLLTEAILTGEFRFDQEFIEENVEDFLTAKREVLQTNSSPIFLYAHSKFPGHSQNSGHCLPNETQLFGERLKLANLEVRQDLELLIENDPEAIIIVAGDHGPYLTKNCFFTNFGDFKLSEITRLDIQDRNGTFLAIRWPTESFDDFDDIAVLQDLFPSIFAYLFRDSSFLEAKVIPATIQNERNSGASVENGIIHGGVDDNEPLFLFSD